MKCTAYLVSDYFATSHTFVRREVEALADRGMEIRVFTIRGSALSSGAAEVARIIGQPIHRFLSALILQCARHPVKVFSAWNLANRHRVPGIKAWVWAQFHFLEAVYLSLQLERSDCRRLHCHFANSGAVVGLIASRIADIPWSLTLHGISELDYPSGKLLGQKVELADFVACASYFMRAQAMRMVHPKHWGKLHIVRCGVDLSEIPSKKRISRQAYVRLVCVGRLSAEKGHLGLIEALASLARQNIGFEATIVGDGPTLADVQSSVERAGIADRVRFTGALPAADAMKEIATADIFVLPSLMEGLPVVLIEALACRTASIASRVAGIPELLADGVTGLLFTPSDWQDLSDKLRQLIEDQGYRSLLAEAGRKAVEADFAIGHSADKLIYHFDRLESSASRT